MDPSIQTFTVKDFSVIMQICDSIPDALFAINVQGEILIWNKAMEELSGVKADLMLGKKNYEHSLVTSGKRCPNLIDYALDISSSPPRDKGPIVRIGDAILSWKEGFGLLNRGHFTVTARPIYDEKGAILGAVEVIRETAKTGLLQEALILSAERYRHLVEDSFDGIFIQKGRKIVFASRPLHKMLGYEDGELLGKEHWIIYHPDFRHLTRERAEARMRGEDVPTHYEVKLMRKDGSWFYGEIGAKALEIDGEPGIQVWVRDINEQKVAKEALRESEERFKQTFYTSPDAITLGRLEDAVFTDVNEGFLKLTGYLREEVIGRTSYELDIWCDIKDRERMVSELKEKGFCENLEARLRRKDGSVGLGLVSAKIIKLGDALHTLTITRDITELRRAEEAMNRLEQQLLQVQKMESVGRLAGGVAHDFNNMLGVILGRAELAIASLSSTDPVRRDLLDIQSAARRSAELTKQLLAFARRQPAEPRVLNLNDTIQGMLNMLKRLIGEDIELEWLPGSNLCPVKMDPAQIDQILANLVVNARDAIADVGYITIETQNCVLDDRYCKERPYASPGRYAVITVSDSGCGMTHEVMERIFEPFFTTKEAGKGTGLGLATVYGIVKQNEGYINVYSEPGQGSSFKIYLPASVDESPQERPPQEDVMPKGGRETILLVEDEPMLLEIESSMLERLGYKVLKASGPLQALETLGSYQGQIDLLMTDVVMPEMNGRVLWEKAKELRPAMKCLFISGYTVNVIARHGVLQDGVNFIQKPITISELGRKIRDILH